MLEDYITKNIISIINEGEHTGSNRDQPEDDWQWVQERY